MNKAVPESCFLTTVEVMKAWQEAMNKGVPESCFLTAVEVMKAWYISFCTGVRGQHTTCSILTGRYLERMSLVRRMMHL